MDGKINDNNNFRKRSSDVAKRESLERYHFNVRWSITVERIQNSWRCCSLTERWQYWKMSLCRYQCSIFSDFNNLCAESKLPAMIPYWHWAPLCLSCLFVFSVFLFTSKYFFVVCGQHQFCFICYITYSKLHSRSVYYMFLPIYSLPFYNKMLSSQFVATHKCPHYLNMNLILFKIRHCKDQDTALGLHFSKSCLSDLLIAISEIPQM